jgi:DNA-binding NarL/FixJ family response regulator
MLEGVRGLLESAFESVVMVADETSLFEAIDKIRPEMAVVDLSLPFSGETHIARRLTARYPTTKLIILSATMMLLLRWGAVVGRIGFVLKRSAGEDLLAAIDSINENRIFVFSCGKEKRMKLFDKNGQGDCSENMAKFVNQE